MMHSIIVITFAFVGQVHAKEPTASDNMHHSADKLVDELSDRAFKAVPEHHADLDNAMLGKPARLGTPTGARVQGANAMMTGRPVAANAIPTGVRVQGGNAMMMGRPMTMNLGKQLQFPMMSPLISPVSNPFETMNSGREMPRQVIAEGHVSSRNRGFKGESPNIFEQYRHLPKIKRKGMRYRGPRKWPSTRRTHKGMAKRGYYMWDGKKFQTKVEFKRQQIPQRWTPSSRSAPVTGEWLWDRPEEVPVPKRLDHVWQPGDPPVRDFMSKVYALKEQAKAGEVIEKAPTLIVGGRKPIQPQRGSEEKVGERRR